jgi:lipopolysaccharide transport system ATP-binding protein
MCETVITVENLSKRYLIGHQATQNHRHRYVALRDVIVREVGNFSRKSLEALRGRRTIQSNRVEEFWALKDINFDIKQGEVIGVIGRNGAGKSTLLKVLSRITEPTTGRVVLRGRVASLLEVGTGFHPELTGRENIFLNGAVLGMTRKEIRRKFDEIVAFAEVEKFLDTPVKRYSSGMYVRLAFAVAAHLEPEILVIDEVLAVGDTEFQKKCLGKMSEVARGGRTILFVSHNHGAVRNLCTHGIVMHDGRASPKYDIATALAKYSAESSVFLGSSWTRPESMAKPSVRFETIDAGIEGTQPNLRLWCRASIRSESTIKPYLIAVNVLDPTFAVVMQALPNAEAFIEAIPGLRHVELVIELPPLVPGNYSLDLWIGPHHQATYDYLRQAVTVQVAEDPSPGRTLPRRPENGFIAAKSTVIVRPPPTSRKALETSVGAHQAGEAAE